jgi:hypothetical protein
MNKNQIISNANISDDLKFRLKNCGISCNFPAGLGFYSCGAMACRRCERRARARWLASAAAWMARARPSDLHLIEVEVCVVDRLDGLESKIKRWKRSLRNLVGRWRRGGGFRSHSHLRGLCGIIFGPHGWRLVARFVVDLCGAAVQPLAERLRRLWPDTKIRPVDHQPQAAAWCWPDFTVWSVTALSWLNENRNLQILRISVGQVGARSGRSTVRPRELARVDQWADEPLPVIF